MSGPGTYKTRTAPPPMIPRAVAGSISPAAFDELARLPGAYQEEFVTEFERRKKSLAMAYLCSLFYGHYAYLGRTGMTGMMWVVSLITFGIAGFVWWVIDLFRMPGIVADYNDNVSDEVLRNIKP